MSLYAGVFGRRAAPRRCGARLAGQPAGGVLPQGLGGGWAASRRAIPPAPLRRPPLVGCAAWDHIVEFFQGLGQVEAIFSIELRKRVIAQLSYAIGVAKLLSLFVETYGTEQDYKPECAY